MGSANVQLPSTIMRNCLWNGEYTLAVCYDCIILGSKFLAVPTLRILSARVLGQHTRQCSVY